MEPAGAGALMREHAKSFAFAARFLPAVIRRDVASLYAFCRTLDDLVDCRPALTPIEQVRDRLDGWQRWLASSPVPPNGSALTTELAAVVNRHAIPARHLIELIEGCKADLRPRQFQQRAELDRYCYQAGGTVGLALCPILGVSDQRGLDCARQLGMAMQLTNVLRDVPEDLAQGRSYLPAQELQAAGSLPAAVRAECQRARDSYQAGLQGIPWIDPAARYAIRLAAALYEAILDKLAAQGFDPYIGRASTTLREKVWLALKLRLAG